MASGYAKYLRPIKPVRYKFLSSINLGGNEIRYLGVNEQNNGVHFPKSVHNCPGRLLFLASDVLSGTTVSKKNHIRVHSRYAKSGFACKLRLTGFKIEGINNSGTMWFYNIQGLFHVTFELHNLATQKDCLTTLQLKFLVDLPLEYANNNGSGKTAWVCRLALPLYILNTWRETSIKGVWLQRFNDPPMQADGVIRYNLRLKTEPDPVSPSIDLEALVSAGGDRADKHGISYSKVVVLTDGTDDVQFELGDSDDASPLEELKDSGVAGEDQPEEVTGELGAGEFIEQLITFVRSSISSVNEVSHQVICQILLTLDYLKHISSQEEEHFMEWGSTFFSMMEEYLLLIKCDTSDDSFENTFGLPREKFVLLYVISDWLGKEFHKLESQVSQKVELYKKRNIGSIDNLPPSESTIDMLFPICMKKLMVNWLGGPKDDATSLDWLTSVAFSDHNYSPPAKVKKKGHPNYPLVQLILEFTTNSLISGVAHVVYSRLRCTE